MPHYYTGSEPLARHGVDHREWHFATGPRSSRGASLGSAAAARGGRQRELVSDGRHVTPAAAPPLHVDDITAPYRERAAKPVQPQLELRLAPGNDVELLSDRECIIHDRILHREAAHPARRAPSER
jgi:hypothetical protein